MKKKYVCLNKPCVKGSLDTLCVECSDKLLIKYLRNIVLVVLSLLFFVTSIVEYQDSYIWFFSNLGDAFVLLYNNLPSFVQTFLKVALYSIPVILFGGLIVVGVWVKLEELSDYRY